MVYRVIRSGSEILSLSYQKIDIDGGSPSNFFRASSMRYEEGSIPVNLPASPIIPATFRACFPVPQSMSSTKSPFLILIISSVHVLSGTNDHSSGHTFRHLRENPSQFHSFSFTFWKLNRHFG